MKKLIVILMALIAYSTQALADKVSFTASAPDVVVARLVLVLLLVYRFVSQ